jgi:nitric oxide reductase subunit B
MDQASLAQALPFGLVNQFRLANTKVHYRSQLLAYPYFLFSAVLFSLQILFGLNIVAQFIWPTYLMNVLPFNIGRATHLNLLVFWLLLGLMGAAYYLVPEETKSEIFSIKLGIAQLAIMLFSGLGTLFTFWFFHDSLGKPFTEAPMPWPIFIALGVVLFLVNIGITLFRTRRWTAITTVLFGGMAGLALLYLSNFIFFRNLTVDYFWWWWIIHLWVEGSWELIAAALMAYLLIRETGMDRKRIHKYLYAEVSLVLFTGIIGIGHHYYWIGTPAYWLVLGAVFSALEPVPIVLMTYDALSSMRNRVVEPNNRVTWLWLGGSAVAHLLGAGVWGFAQTLPQINQWTHGTQITAAHGHFAFFGAFGMLVLAAIYFMVPQLRGLAQIKEGRGKWSFWLMATGMIGIVFCFTIAGVINVYMSRMAGLPYITVRDTYLRFWFAGIFTFGLLLFTPGITLYIIDFFGLKPERKEEILAQAPAT